MMILISTSLKTGNNFSYVETSLQAVNSGSILDLGLRLLESNT
jgi:hypothetical protein